MKVGFAFPDYIHQEKRSFFDQRNHFKDDKELRMRSNFLPLLISICALVLIGKLFFLQIIQGQYYRDISNTNRLRTTIIHSPRGIIFDRKGVPLVFNAPGFRETLNGKTSVIDQQKAVQLIAKGDKNLEVDSLRNYPFKDSMAHIVGYISQISQDDLKNPIYKDYYPGALIGKMGIEEFYESVLKGKDGQSLIEVNAAGKKFRTLGQTDPIPGQNITITIDSDLQQSAYSAMSDVKKGAVIVSNPKGDILAMVSKPSFDPNLFIQDGSYKATESGYTTISDILSDNQNQPLLNRAISGVYPPGSTFKIVVASAALEEHLIDENYTVEDTGILKVGDFSFSNWYYSQYGKTEGSVNVIKAIQRSNDTYFYKIGDLLGVDKLSAFARKIGLGNTLGLDLNGEKKGLVPTKEWKKKMIGEDWYLGDNYHYGIGQGYLLTTPLQVNAWTQVIANNGNLFKPHFLKESPKLINKEIISAKSITLIRDGMIAVCNQGGVAYPLFDFKVKNKKLLIDSRNFSDVPEATTSGYMNEYRKVVVACKTGTAQHGGEETKPHAWITLYAPAYNPQIIVTVLAEDSGEGSEVAAPIAKNILQSWFEKQ